MEPKIAMTEALIEVLTEVLDLESTTDTARKLVAVNIYSFDDFLWVVQKAATRILNEQGSR